MRIDDAPIDRVLTQVPYQGRAEYPDGIAPGCLSFGLGPQPVAAVVRPRSGGLHFLVAISTGISDSSVFSDEVMARS